MSVEDDVDDPLSIGKCKVGQTASIPPPSVRKIRMSSSQVTDLFEVERDSRPRSTSLSKMSQSNRKAFESDMPVHKTRSTDFSLPLPDLASPAPLTTIAPENEFDAFLIEEDLYKHVPISNALKEKRAHTFGRNLSSTERLLNDLKANLNDCVLARSEELRQSEGVFGRLLALRRRGVESQRRNAAIHIIYHRKQMKIYKLRSKPLQRNVERVVGFLEYLRGLPDRYELLPQIDLKGFRKSFEEPHPHIHVLEQHVTYLKAHQKDLIEQKPGTGDWYANLLHPQTKTGKVIQRYEERIDALSYEDVQNIIKHLGTGKAELRKLEALFFDLAWAKHQYPFGFSGTRALPANGRFLPVKGDLFPAVIGENIIDAEYEFVPFSALNGMNWPFKSAVDMIFEMMMLTNPFDIARVYWNVIQNCAECMHRVLVLKGVNRDDIEIDFDSLFPTLMICVFTFGIDEWMQVALYAISFNEHVSDDPQLQFAMTYLEGLVTQIIALDQKTLKEKAVDLRRKWADGQSDPLGLR
jgi:hypothetical protein